MEQSHLHHNAATSIHAHLPCQQPENHACDNGHCHCLSVPLLLLSAQTLQASTPVIAGRALPKVVQRFISASVSVAVPPPKPAAFL